MAAANANARDNIFNLFQGDANAPPPPPPPQQQQPPPRQQGGRRQFPSNPGVPNLPGNQMPSETPCASEYYTPYTLHPKP